MVLPKEVWDNDFPNKRYNHITSLYQKYNLLVRRTKIEYLFNLTKLASNLPQLLYPNVPGNDIPYILHHEFTSRDKNRDRMKDWFVDQSLQKLLKYMNDISIFLLRQR